MERIKQVELKAGDSSGQKKKITGKEEDRETIEKI